MQANRYQVRTNASYSGSITTADGLFMATPSFLGSTPSIVNGLKIANQGVTGVTNAYGLFIETQSGATNNYAAVFQGGNVGIGTTTPSTALEVAGQVKITGGSPGAGKVLTSDAVGLATWDLGTPGPTGPPGGLYNAYILVSEQYPQGTQVPSVPGSFATRNINTEDADPQNIASVNDSTITLAAGTYRCRISVPTFRSYQTRAWLKNIDTNTILVVSASAYNNSLEVVSRIPIIGLFTLTVQSNLKIQHATKIFNNEGFGLVSNFPGLNEIYTIAEFFREE